MIPLKSIILEIKDNKPKVIDAAEGLNTKLLDEVNNIIVQTISPLKTNEPIVGVINHSDMHIVVYGISKAKVMKIRYFILNNNEYKLFDYNPYVIVDSLGDLIDPENGKVTFDDFEIKDLIPNDAIKIAFQSYPGGRDTLLFLMDKAIKTSDSSYIIGKNNQPENKLFRAICQLIPMSERNKFTFISYASKPIKGYFNYLYTSKETFVNFDLEQAKGLKTVNLDDFAEKPPASPKTKYGKFLTVLFEKSFDEAIAFINEINGIIKIRTANYKILKEIPDNFVDYIRFINMIKTAQTPDAALGIIKNIKSIYLDSKKITELLDMAWEYFEKARKLDELKASNFASSLSDVWRKHISNLKIVAQQEENNKYATKYITEMIIPKLEIIISLNPNAAYKTFSTIYQDFITDKTFGLSKPFLEIALYISKAFKDTEDSILVKLNQNLLQILENPDIIKYILKSTEYLPIDRILIDDAVILLNTLLREGKKIQLEANLGKYSEVISTHYKNGRIDDSVLREIIKKLVDILIQFTVRNIQDKKIDVFELFDPVFDLLIAYKFENHLTSDEKIALGNFGSRLAFVYENPQSIEKYIKFEYDAESVEVDNLHKSLAFRNISNLFNEVLDLKVSFKRPKSITRIKFEFSRDINPEFINNYGLEIYVFVFALFDKSQECRYQLLTRLDKLIQIINSENTTDIEAIVEMTHSEATKLKNSEMIERALSLYNIALAGLSKINNFSQYIEIANEIIPIVSNINDLAKYAEQIISLYSKLDLENLAKYHELNKNIVYRIYPNKKELALQIMLKELSTLKEINPDLYFETLSYNITLAVSDSKIVIELFSELLSSKIIDAEQFINLTADTIAKAYKNNTNILDSLIEKTLIALINNNDLNAALKIIDLAYSKIEKNFEDFSSTHLRQLLQIPLDKLLQFIDLVIGTNQIEGSILANALTKLATNAEKLDYSLAIAERTSLVIANTHYTQYIQNIQAILDSISNCEKIVLFEQNVKNVLLSIKNREDNPLGTEVFNELLNTSIKYLHKCIDCLNSKHLKVSPFEYSTILIDISKRLNIFDETTLKLIEAFYEQKDFLTALNCWKYSVDYAKASNLSESLKKFFNEIVHKPELMQNMSGEDFIKYIPIAVDINEKSSLLILIVSKYISNAVTDVEEFIADLGSLGTLLVDIKNMPEEQAKTLIDYVSKFSELLPITIARVIKSVSDKSAKYTQIAEVIGKYLAITISNEYYDTSSIIEEQIKFWFSTNNSDAVVVFLESIMNNLSEKYREPMLNNFFDKVQNIEINATTSRVYADALRALTKYMKKNGEKIMKQSAKMLASVPAGPGLIIPFIVPKSKNEEPPIKTKNPEDLTKLVLDITNNILKSTKVQPRTPEEEEIYVIMGRNLDSLTKYFRERAGITDWLIKDQKEAKKLKKYKAFFDKTLDILDVIFETYNKLSEEHRKELYEPMRDITESQLYYWSAIGELKTRRYLCAKINRFFKDEPELKMSCFGF